MTAYFLDSTATVKLYAGEAASSWLGEIGFGHYPEELIVVRTTQMDIGAALCRRVRDGRLTSQEAEQTAAVMKRDFEATFRVIELTSSLADLALDIAARRGLNGASVQVAAALLANRARCSIGFGEVVFVTTDEQLRVAAEAEGMRVEDLSRRQW